MGKAFHVKCPPSSAHGEHHPEQLSLHVGHQESSGNFRIFFFPPMVIGTEDFVCAYEPENDFAQNAAERYTAFFAHLESTVIGAALAGA